MQRLFCAFAVIFLTSAPFVNGDPLRVIITGGPGAGKTTILLGLEQRGYDIVTEAATDVIKMDLACNITHPWDHMDFQKKVLDLQNLREEKSLKSDKPIVFYDRSPFDTMTYALLRWPNDEHKCINESIEYLKECDFYYPTVFVIENFGQCLNNEIRHESRDEALFIEQSIENDYRKHGFKVVKIPAGHPEQRIQQILGELNQGG